MADQNKAGLNEQPFMSHLLELRDRVLRMVLGVLLVFLVLSPFSNDIFNILADPLSRNMPEGSSLIAIRVIAPFLIPLKATLVVAIFIAMPWVLYQAWSFIAPGLYIHEKKIALPVLASSTFLFYAGAAFAYFVILPIVSMFMTSTGPESVELAPDIGEFLDFALMLFFAFGLAFQVPIIAFVLVFIGATTADALAAKRPYIIVGAFVVGMLLTPPDIISQTLLAVPMWLLFEVGVLISRRIRRPQPESDYQPMTDEEMEAELDRIDQEEHKS